MSGQATQPHLRPDELGDELLSRGRHRQRALEETYDALPSLGLVLGAGVTAAHLPTYDEFVLRLLEEVLRARAVTGGWHEAFVQEQRDRLGAGRSTVPPDVVAILARQLWGREEPVPHELVDLALWGQARGAGVVTDPTRSRSYARKRAWDGNDTLHAIVTFCTRLAAGEPAANDKVDAVLTTNYDNLLEAAAHGKYRTFRLFQPVARSTSVVGNDGKRQIPVIHIHGYASYREPGRGSSRLVIEERDYFDFSYAPLGFGSYMTMAFLQRLPVVFVGSRLTDPNLRRMLHQIAEDSGTGTLPHPAYALMKLGDDPQDHVLDMVTDDVLADYGVQVVWVDGFGRIPDVLRTVYSRNDDATATMWDDIWSYSAYRKRSTST